MEFSIKPNLCLNIWFIVGKCHFRELSAQLKLASCCNLVLILGVWVNLTLKDNFIFIKIPNLNTNSLMWRFALISCFVVGH